LIAILMMGGAERLVAQGRGGGGQREEMELRVQARFDNMVREQLGLSDEQVESLQDVVLDFRRRRVEFSQDERAARARVAGLGRGNAGDLTDDEASEILRDMRELSGEEASLFREEQEALLEILSPAQVVRFIVMRQQLGDRIRGLRGRGGPPRGPQGGRGPGIR
jgi:hypothetical protein